MLQDFRRVLAYLPRYRGAVALGLLAIPLSRGMDLLIPWIIGRGIDELRNDTLTFSLSGYFWIIIALAAVKGVGKYAMRFFIVSASRRFEEDFRNDIYRHTLTLPPSWFQSMRSGDLMTRLAWDVEAVRMLLGPGVMYLTETIFMLPAVVVLAFFDPLLAVLMLIPLFLIAAVMKHYAEPIHRESLSAQEKLASMSNQAEESFSGMRVVRSFAQENRQIDAFDASSEKYMDQNVKLTEIRGRNWTLLLSAKDLGMLLLVSVGCFRLYEGQITVGEFWVFVMYLGLLFWPMIALGWMIGMIQRGRASMQRLNQVLDTPPALKEPDDAYRPETFRGEIELKNLRCTLGEREILKGINLKMDAGTVLGVTGPTGSGKSTFAQVFSRLVDIAPNQVFLDGVDITEWDPTRLRRSIGFVPQEAFLFVDTLRSNIALGRDDEDDEAIHRALRTAHVHDEIQALSGGLDAVVGERGVTLSGGQRQRVTIARALAADPRALVLDDCLSAVDADTEASILEDLVASLRNRTSVLVSHRVSALQLADHVIVLDDGQVVEQGSPEELLRLRGRYWRLHQRQRAEDELDRL